MAHPRPASAPPLISEEEFATTVDDLAREVEAVDAEFVPVGKVLEALISDDALDVSAVAQRSTVSSDGVAKALTRLQDLGLVRVSKADSHITVELTTQGRYAADQQRAVG
jgi:DNA-binding MarR family transcriptional regulator